MRSRCLKNRFTLVLCTMWFTALVCRAPTTPDEHHTEIMIYDMLKLRKCDIISCVVLSTNKSRVCLRFANHCKVYSSDAHKEHEGEHSGHAHVSSYTPYPPLPPELQPKKSFGEWLFDENMGWKRPLKKKEGGTLRPGWNTFGYNYNDEHKDWLYHHVVMFSVVTCFLVVGVIFLHMFHPDYWFFQYRNWARREAFLEIERRKKLGLPLISPDLLPPERVLAACPTDEELGDYPIII